MPIVSFIITYHDEPPALLAECLQSVLSVRCLMRETVGQEWDCEVIVVDDGSQASAESLVHGLDAQACYVRQPNAGLSAARNMGMARARGEYLQFVDADDALIPQAYCSLCPHDAQQPDVILFRFTTREADYRTDHAPAALSPAARGRGHMASGRTVDGAGYMLGHNLRASACCYLMRRSVLQGLRFAEGLLHEDELFTPLLLLRARSVLDTGARAYYYRQRPGTITHSLTACQARRRMDDTLEVLRRLMAVGRTLEGAPRMALRRRVEQLATDYIYNVWLHESDSGARRKRMAQMREEGLLPLPLRGYTPRHLLFALALRLPYGLLDRLLCLALRLVGARMRRQPGVLPS